MPDSLGIQKNSNRVSVKAKISKVAEFCECFKSSPFFLPSVKHHQPNLIKKVSPSTLARNNRIEHNYIECLGGAETPFSKLGRENVNGTEAENGEAVSAFKYSSSMLKLFKNQDDPLRRPNNGSTIQIMTLLENNLNNINSTRHFNTIFKC